MKMAYETPKMRVEQFQTNAYCASCGNQPYFTGWLSVVYGGVTNWFFGDNKISMLNQNEHNNPQTRQQYYYKQVNRVKNDDGTYSAEAMTGNILYLEYSAPHNEFVLYREVGEVSGYYNDYTGSYWDWDGQSDPDNYSEHIDGSNSLQANWGSRDDDPDFAHDPGMSRGGTTYFEMDSYGNPIMGANGKYKEASADRWYADHCLGVTSYTREEGFKMIPS